MQAVKANEPVQCMTVTVSVVVLNVVASCSLRHGRHSEMDVDVA
jgi:hypothetical protein